MIHLINVSKKYPGAEGWHEVLKPFSMSIPSKARVGVLGYNGSGKSTFLNVLSGVEQPDTGEVIRNCRVSWPLGFGGGVHGELSGNENVAFIARIYDVDLDRVIRFVDDFAELGSYMRMPVRTYSSGMRARLAFGISMAIDFDFYLIDEVTGVGDSTFKRKAKYWLNRRLRNAGLLFVSHSEGAVRQYCTSALVLDGGHIRAFSSLDNAREFYALIATHRNAKDMA